MKNISDLEKEIINKGGAEIRISTKKRETVCFVIKENLTLDGVRVYIQKMLKSLNIDVSSNYS